MFTYNHLNLPESVGESGGSGAVQWLYDANGTKLRKSSNAVLNTLQLSGTIASNAYQADQIASDGTVPTGNNVFFQAGNEIELQAGFETELGSDFEAEVTTITGGGDHDYVNGIEYRGGVLEAFYHAEGRIYFDNGTPRYEYTITDHLGNTRVTFVDLDGDGPLNEVEILQENHYYPFGMAMDGEWAMHPERENLYQYNGKELNEDLGLNWLDYGARWYDPSIGRFSSVDPLAESMSSWSPYNYGFNNPVRYTDPDGAAPDDIVYFNTDGQEIHRIESETENRVYVARQSGTSGAAAQEISQYDETVQGRFFDEAPMPGVAKGYEADVFQQHDYEIAAQTALFNRDLENETNLPTFSDGHQVDSDLPGKLDVNVVKSMVIEESRAGASAGPSGTGKTDIMQVNNKGDWASSKTRVGLSKGETMTPRKSLNAGTRWLFLKGMSSDAKGNMNWGSGSNGNWWNAVKRYNGGGNPNYLKEVKKIRKSIR